MAQIRTTVSFFKEIKFNKSPLPIKAKVFWGFILIIFIYTLFNNLYWPIFDWDALALYDFRAKTFLIDKNLAHAVANNDYFMGYPLFTSLAHLFIYQTGLNNPKFIYSLFYISFVCIFYSSLRGKVGNNRAMFFASILALTPEVFAHSTIAYTNLAYATYLCSGVFYLYNWINTREKPYLLISALLIGLSSWVRIAEPFWLAPILVVAVCSLKNRRVKDFLYFLFTVVFFYLSWTIFTMHTNAVNNFSSNNLNAPRIVSIIGSITLERILVVSNYLYKYVFSTWGLTFLLFITTSILAFLNKKDTRPFLYMILIFFAILCMGTFGFFAIYPDWQDIPDSVRRMGMFFLPLMIYSIALNTKFYEKNK